jgi:hypothetical protein
LESPETEEQSEDAVSDDYELDSDSISSVSDEFSRFRTFEFTDYLISDLPPFPLNKIALRASKPNYPFNYSINNSAI